MSPSTLSQILTGLAFASIAQGSVPVYGQCGGQGYSGDTDCDSGSYCTSYNAYYYQCIPGTATTTVSGTTTTTPGTTTSTKPVSTTTTTTSRTTSQGGATTTTSSSSSGSTSISGVKYIFNFGDSYSSTGFWVGGDKPNAQNPLGNPTFPGSTWTCGMNWVGSIVSEFNTSTTLMYNFAEGGAVTDSDLVTPYSTSIQNFDDQVDEFVEYLASHPDYAPWTEDNTVATVWIGVNDIGQPFFSSIDPPLGDVLDRYFDLLQTLYDNGLRNFRLLAVPPFDETPLMLSQYNSIEPVIENIAYYNSVLASKLSAFKSTNSDIISAAIVDTAPAFDEPISNPTAYGAADATCVSSDGTSCLWCDTYHPGYAIERLVAKAVANSMSGTFFRGLSGEYPWERRADYQC